MAEQVILDIRIVAITDNSTSRCSVEQYKTGELNNVEDDLLRERLEREVLWAFLTGIPEPLLRTMPKLMKLYSELKAEYESDPETFGQECSPS